MTAWEINPGKLLEISGSYWRTSVLHAAVKLDVFTAIGSESSDADALAGKLSADSRALAMLLNALTAMGLLVKKGASYANTPVSAAFLSKHSSRYIGFIIMHHYHLAESWLRLDQAVLAGRPVRTRAAAGDADRREAFLMGMFNMAMSVAPRIVKAVDLSGRRRLLDLGGGPGTYAVHFCRATPEMRATVYDLAATRPFAEKTIAQFNLADRIDFMDGDYVTEERIKGSFDAAWLSHILHGEGPQTCREIIRKTVSALEPGGMLVVHEFVLNNEKDGPLFPTLFSLNMLLGTEGGQAYSEKEIMDMLAGAGLKDIKRIPFDSPNDSGLISGTVPR
ncbi:MAG: methyltransferase [Thermodesulfobacteriota bacterium]